MSTHNLCFRAKIRKILDLFIRNYHFYSREILLYISWACLRNVCNCSSIHFRFGFEDRVWLVGWLIDSERPGKQFFSHVGTEPPLPGYYQYFWGVNMPCSRTQHGLTRVGLEPPTSGPRV